MKLDVDNLQKLPLGHAFVPPYESPGDLNPSGTGCAFIMGGSTWGLGDIKRCLKSEKAHQPVNISMLEAIWSYVKEAFS